MYRHGELDVKKLILSVGMLVAVLILTVFFLSIVTETPLNPYSDESEDVCAGQDSEEACTSVVNKNWFDEDEQQCSWHEDEQECGRIVN